MCRRKSLWLIVALFAGIAAAPPSDGQEPGTRTVAIEEVLNEGRRAFARGDYATALKGYQEARRAAWEVGAEEAAAGAALKAADVILTWVTADQAVNIKEDWRWQEGLKWYEDAIRLGSPRQRVLAQNNRGSLLLRQQNAPEALKAFRQIDFAAVEPSQRFLYLYNLGRALEANKDSEGAYQCYLQVVTQKPEFEPASQGAFRILEQSAEPRIDEVANLAATLLAKGQIAVAEPPLRSSLQRWGAAEGAPLLLAVVADYYVAAGVDPPRFQEKEWMPLSTLAARFPNLERAVTGLHDIYLSDRLKPTLRGSEVSKLFPGWSHDQRQAESYSLLLKKVGDFYAQKQDTNQALARYTAAWALDPRNTEAALSTALLLHDHRELDPEGRLSEQFIASLVAENGQAYRVSYDKKADLQNLLRVHFVLGKKLARENKWGSENEPGSAIAQWTRAQQAEGRIREKDLRFALSPGLHTQLAGAYQKGGRTDLAWNQYLRAAEGYLQLAKPKQASTVLQNADALGHAPSQEEKKLLEGIRLQIERPVAPPWTRQAKLEKLETQIKKIETEMRARKEEVRGYDAKIAVLRKQMNDLENKRRTERERLLTADQVKRSKEPADAGRLPELTPAQAARVAEIDTEIADLRRQLEKLEAMRRAEPTKVSTPEAAKRPGAKVDPKGGTGFNPNQGRRTDDMNGSSAQKTARIAQLLRRIKELEADKQAERRRVLRPEPAKPSTAPAESSRLPDREHLAAINADFEKKAADMLGQIRKLEAEKQRVETTVMGYQNVLNALRLQLSGLKATQPGLGRGP